MVAEANHVYVAANLFAVPSRRINSPLHKGVIYGAVLLALSIYTSFAAEMNIHRDLPYAEPKNERQSLDVYSPAKAPPGPVIVWIHGGGWQRGDKSTLAVGKPEQHLFKPQVFTDHGCVFVAINYRFVPNVDLKTMAGDVAKAIAWVKKNIREYGGDPGSIFVMGHSAGAQLAAWVSIDERFLNAQGLALRDLKGCVPVDGDSYYITLQIDTSHLKLASSYRMKFPEGSERDLSSVLHIAKDKGIPPFLILCVADFPESGAAMQSQILSYYLNVAAVPARVLAVPGKTHSTLNSDLGAPNDDATRQVLEFVDRTTKPAP